MMWECLCLLLPIAAYSGWWIGRRAQKIEENNGEPLSSEYYRGLNFLLNEEPNKAVDVFIRMLDASPESFDTTLALGNFFRRRGEVDRAIRIHESLQAKPDLSDNQRIQSMLALAEDYMRAGVYDRAESFLLQMNEKSKHGTDISLRYLITIYEREKEWEKAIDVAERLQSVSRQSMGKEIAQYYCELAELAWAKGQIRTAFKHLKQGLQSDSNCARISLLQGHFKTKLNKHKDALMAYKRIEFQDNSLLAEALPMIMACYEHINETEALSAYLDYLMHHHPTMNIALASAERIKVKSGTETASQFLAKYIHNEPSIHGLKHLIEFHLTNVVGVVRTELVMLKSLIEHLLENRATYRCHRCGFSSRSLQWQCPSCRQWATVKPILGIEGE